MREAVIIVMAKQPQVGRTKTRLCPPLSWQDAAALYEALLLDTLSLVSALQGIDLAVAITPPESQPYFERIAPAGTLLLPIEGSDIGDCLSQVIKLVLNMGYCKALALNSDGPSLPPEYLQQAVDYLDRYDLVLGPGHDGGYYLVGMRRAASEIFRGIAWSTDKVLSQTLERARALGLQVWLTPEWYDVDTAADLGRLQADVERLPQDRLVFTRRFMARDDAHNLPR